MAKAPKIEVEVKAKIDDFNKKMSEMNKGLKEMSQSFASRSRALRGFESSNDRYARSFDSLREKYILQASSIKELEKAFNRVKVSRDDALKTRDTFLQGTDDWKKYDNQVQSLDKTLDNFSTRLNKSKNSLKDLEIQLRLTAEAHYALNNPVSKLGQMLEEKGESIKNFSNHIRNFGLTLAPLSLAMGAFGKKSFDAFTEFESGVAGVRKTKDFLPEELKVFENQARQLAKTKPLPLKDILGVAELGGQLDISKESLIDFSEVVNELAVTTDVNAEEGALKLAQFAKLASVNEKEFRNMGSALVELGNNSATTESTILEFMHKLGGVGVTTGIKAADIMGIATTLAQAGLQVESGGNNMAKTILEMSFAVTGGSEAIKDFNSKLQESGYTIEDARNAVKGGEESILAFERATGLAEYSLEATLDLIDNGKKDLSLFARHTGKSAEEFANAWNDKPIKAVELFINGLRNAKQNGVDLNGYLEELGIKSQRQKDVLLKLAGTSKDFSETLEMSNTAWEENIALTKEANIRYETTEQKLQLMKNKLNDTAITIGDRLAPYIIDLADWVGNLVEKFDSLDKETQDLIIKFGGILALTSPIALTLSPIVGIVGDIIKGTGVLLGSKGLGGIIGKQKLVKDGLNEIGELASGEGGINAIGKASTSVSKGGLTLVIKKLGTIGGMLAKGGAIALGIFGLGTLIDSVLDKIKKNDDWLTSPIEDKNSYQGQGVYSTTQMSDTSKEQLLSVKHRQEEVNRLLKDSNKKNQEEIKADCEEVRKIYHEQDEYLLNLRKSSFERQKEDLKNNSFGIPKERLQEITASMEEHYNEQLEKQADYHHRRDALVQEYANADMERRMVIRSELLELDRQWREMEVDELGQSEEEKNTIRARMEQVRLEATKENAKQLQEELQAHYNNEITMAENHYLEVLKNIGRLREGGEITQEEYQKMTESAHQNYLDEVGTIKKKTKEILDEINGNNREIEGSYNETTGKIKIEYSKRKVEDLAMIESAENTKKSIKDKIDEMILKAQEFTDKHGNNTQTIMDNNDNQAKSFSSYAGSMENSMSRVVTAIAGTTSEIERLNGMELQNKTMTITRTIRDSFTGKGPNVNSILYGSGSGRRHHMGLDFVPFNGYNAILHKGERVLTAEQNKNYNARNDKNIANILSRIEKSNKMNDKTFYQKGTTNNNNFEIHLDNVTIKDDRDVKALVKDITEEINRQVVFG